MDHSKCDTQQCLAHAFESCPIQVRSKEEREINEMADFIDIVTDRFFGATVPRIMLLHAIKDQRDAGHKRVS